MATQMLNTGSADFASTSANSGTTSYLIPRTLLTEVISAVRKNLVLRGLAARTFGPGAIPGRTLVIPMQSEFDGNSDMAVDRVAEGGEVLLTQSQFENLTLTPVKYGARVGVSKEMQEDGILDLISYHAELAGYEFADNEESLIVSQLDAGTTASSHTVANSNATLPISDITAAMQQLESANYNPTHMIVGVEIANDLRNIDLFVEQQMGGTGPAGKLIGTIFGMKVIVSNNVSAKLAYVIDAAHAFVIAEKRPLTVEKYADYARDSEFVVITQRIAASYLRAESMSEITTT